MASKTSMLGAWFALLILNVSSIWCVPEKGCPKWVRFGWSLIAILMLFLESGFSLSKDNEALTIYTQIVKNKQYPFSGRFRVNMGNIYFKQEKWTAAIKMYRMALDQIPNNVQAGFRRFPNSNRVPSIAKSPRPIAMTFPKHAKTLHNVWSSVPLKAIRFKIMRNIGHAFFKMHQFPDAIDSYENLLMHGAQHLDFMTGFNLILCYFALGDKATWPAKENRWKRAMIWNWHLCCSVCSIIQWQQADSSRVSPDIVSSVLTDPSIYILRNLLFKPWN